MADASVDLQKAIIDALKASPELTALVGQRIYDEPSPGAAKPYVSLGPEDWISDDAECIRSHEGAVQIDAWSTVFGRLEVKRIANAVEDVLHDATLELTTNALILIEHRITRYFTEADGLTKHAAMDFRAFTEE